MSEAAQSPPTAKADSRVIAVVGMAHFASHFYQLSLPPLFLFIRADFGFPHVRGKPEDSRYLRRAERLFTSPRASRRPWPASWSTGSAAAAS